MWHCFSYLSGVANNIALIPLAAPVEYSSLVLPACLPEVDVGPGENLEVVGWGVTDFSFNSNNLSTILKKALVTIISDADCFASPGFRLASDTFCAESVSGLPCSSDNGGFAGKAIPDDDGNDRYSVNGLVSHFSPLRCASGDTGFTRWVPTTDKFLPLSSMSPWLIAVCLTTLTGSRATFRLERLECLWMVAQNVIAISL